MTATAVVCERCGAHLRTNNPGPYCWPCEHRDEQAKRAQELARMMARARTMIREFYAMRAAV